MNPVMPAIDAVLSFEELASSLNENKKRLQDAKNAVLHLTGAINLLHIQMQECVEKHNKKLQAKAEEEKNNATQEGKQPEDSISEHQDGDCSGEAPEASSCDSIEQSGQEQQ